ELFQPLIAALFAPKPQHGRGIRDGLIGWVHRFALVVLESGLLLAQSVRIRERSQERHVTLPDQRFRLVDLAASSSIVVSALKRVHADVAHKHGESGGETRMTVTKGVEVASHLVK